MSASELYAGVQKALALYLDAKKVYADVHAEYRRSGRWADPDYMAKKDTRVKSAITDGMFYGNEVQTFAAAYQAEVARESAASPVVPAMSGPIPDRITRPDAAATPASPARFLFEHFPILIDNRRPDEAYRRYAADLDRELPGWWATPKPMASGLAREAQRRRDVAAANERTEDAR